MKITKAASVAIIALIGVAGAHAQSPQRPPPREAIRFGGLEWRIKDSGDRKVGPGPNWFSAENVAVEEGKLRLRATDRGGACVSAEVVASPSLGYGTYRFAVDSNLDALAKNLVLGLFTWDDTSSDSFHREMDVELGKWNQEDNADAQFVIQPHTIPRNILRFRMPRGLRGSLHSFSWAPDRVSFRSEGLRPSGEKYLIQQHVFERMIPQPGKEQTRINLWCVDSKAPVNGVAEVVLSGFEFAPLR